ncbi:hypothetical protein CK203_088650 [Vitis vinifera]|uniref:Uncharacterized protein n=1 Tax=Vitis vinifera TaxID=29760 RepID=A0A438C109_VITVI|nr:hypothetical protein CK203_088650 [Vitis vinifera]
MQTYFGYSCDSPVTTAKIGGSFTVVAFLVGVGSKHWWEEAFHIRPVRRAEEDGEASDVDPENEVDDVVEVEEEVEDAVQLPREAQLPSSSQSRLKRKRDEENDGADISDDESVEDVSLKPH